MKTLKKLFTILAIILVAVMAFAPAKSLANDDAPLTITVTGDVAGRNLSVYKIFKLTKNADGTYTYDWADDAVKTYFTNKKYDTVLKATDYLKTLGKKNDIAGLNAFAQDFYSNAEATPVATTPNGDSTSTKYIYDVTGEGYYLVYDITAADNLTDENGQERPRSAAMLANIEVTEGSNNEIALKAEKTDVTKTVDKKTAGVGEDVEFTVSSKVPNVAPYKTFTFTVVDKLSEGLTLNADSIVVKIGEDTYPATVKDEEENTITQYTVTSSTDETTGETTLTITFTPEVFAKLTDKIGKDITITYNAKVNEKAAVAIENSNEVKIVYSNDPTTDGTGTTEEKKVYVYTFAIDFTKKNVSGNPLEGAEFILKAIIVDEDGNEVTKYVKLDNNYVFDSYVDTEDDATVLTSDDDGLFRVSGLKAGKYELVETVAPDRYDKPTFPFTFEINPTYDNNGKLLSVTFDYTADNVEVQKGYIADKTLNTVGRFAIDVLNAKDGMLPTTGGIGTKIFTVVGIVVMAAAVVALVAHNRKND